MKRMFYRLSILFLALLCGVYFISCTQRVTLEGDYVVIVAKDVTEGTTLLAYMQRLQEEGELDFTADATGMVTSIGGKQNPADWSSCWMLYTSDTQASTTEYVVEYDKKTYGQAIMGAASLYVLEGETYIWWFQSF